MAVRNASNITLKEVVSEMGLPSTSSMLDCVTSANKTGWSASYQGSRDRLSNFRAYTHSSLTYY